ncbi:MAG: geranyl-CoA carboxylase alpha subunit [Candidatus Azotimanducaceae bacterium]
MTSKPISTVLIANRGEIACRIIDSVQAAGLQAIAVYSDADAEALFVAMADASVSLGGNTATQSYLDIDKIIRAAKASGADAIHPGYGFLSENAAFATACADHHIRFIGPSAEAITLMGNKATAKALMLKAGVPCVPGYHGARQDDATLIEAAHEIGFPLMVKAAAGGGGRGMRLVFVDTGLADGIASARAEALSAFGSDELILEKAIINSRHIEIQIAGDAHGNVIHLGERDCSAQRRHQKVIEECPSPFMSGELRERMGQAAINAATAVSYEGVGTVEFLVDEDQQFYFLEMNTRLQVEHPVTELVTDTDLVDWQLQIANGAPLPCSQQDINLDGHAIEVRIYAEDPMNNFMPQAGKVLLFEPYENVGVRIDHGMYSGSVVTPYYDAMLAKLICWGKDREEARRRLIRALTKTRVLGLVTNKAFLIQLLSEPTFVLGETTTSFINPQLLDRLQRVDRTERLAVTAAIVASHGAAQSAWSNTEPMAVVDTLIVDGVEVRCSSLALDGGYRVSLSAPTIGAQTIDAQSIDVMLGTSEAGLLSYTCAGVEREAVFLLFDDAINVDFGSDVIHAQIATYAPALTSDAAGGGLIHASTDGLVVNVLVAAGDSVVKGQTLVLIEAMKMEHRHLADADGEVANINVVVGMQVKNRQLLVELSVMEAVNESA